MGEVKRRVSAASHRAIFALIAVSLSFTPLPQANAAGCPQLPPCSGCGCRGGTGYRAPDGHCVGFRELSKVCGADPAKVCRFENEPNTGRNRDCATGRG